MLYYTDKYLATKLRVWENILYHHLHCFRDLEVGQSARDNISEDHSEPLLVLEPRVELHGLDPHTLAVLNLEHLHPGVHGLEVHGEHQVRTGVHLDPGYLQIK